MKALEFRTKEIQAEWTESVWPNNPSLGLQAAIKHFSAPYAGKIPVWIFGNKEDGFSFCVAAGANSSYSYTGYCPQCQTIDEAKTFVEAKAAHGKLIY